VFAKLTFYAACQAFLAQRMALARAEMQAAQESSNSDTKSSAGDKYETGRAMAQQERDRHAVQLHEAQQLQAALQKINPELASDTVRLGALVTTSLGVFYLSVSVGRLTTADGQEFMAMSPAAPLAAALSGRRPGEEVIFNGKPVRVLAVS
jgi:transcription elongation GreA/GreB family factor